MSVFDKPSLGAGVMTVECIIKHAAMTARVGNLMLHTYANIANAKIVGL
jgi:hypothetical protein